MEGKRFIRTIRLQNILSYGPDAPELRLEPLNVLIGPNASGKSNLLDALSILQSAPRDLPRSIRRGGGTHEWLWKGRDELVPATVDVTVDYPDGIMPLRYLVSFSELRHRFDLLDERIENERPQQGNLEPYLYYRYQQGRPVLNVRSETGDSRFDRSLQREDVHPEKSILSQRRDPDSYPELTYLADHFDRIGLYRQWSIGPDTPYRHPQNADLPQGSLLEGGTNLGLVLNNLLNRPPLKRDLLERLRVFYPHIEDVVTPIIGGAIEVSFHEKGLQHPVPAARLSDGSLRYLSLLSILCHPEPHLVTCIEEPELALHPDIIPEVANLLIEASSRTQLIVTTHSDVLVDALTDVPESVIICEKLQSSTRLHRYDSEQLGSWLDSYKLGELWMSGAIGGTRW